MNAPSTRLNPMFYVKSSKNLLDNYLMALWFSLFPPLLIDSATSVDVEEQLYRLAKDMGITFVTSSQVSNAVTMF